MTAEIWELPREVGAEVLCNLNGDDPSDPEAFARAEVEYDQLKEAMG